mgnify:FL=1
MPIFKLIKDDCFESWWRSYYEIQAETLEEAVELVKNDEVDPYDTEMLPDLMQTPLQVEIFDEYGNLLN